MAELTMTFDIPTSKAIELQKDTPYGVEQFRGKWEDSRTAEDIVSDIYQNRSKQIRESIAL